MRIAVMQPYLFPYIGYFQLVNLVDKFIFYDDVNFIKQGWINRNNILTNHSANLFTVPLLAANSFVEIKDTLIHPNLYQNWKTKFFRSLQQNYSKAPNFLEVFELVESTFNGNTDSINNLAISSIKNTMNYLEIEKMYEVSSVRYTNKDLEKQERLLDICKIEDADQYINPIGGMELYSNEVFHSQNIKLNFIRSKPIQYQQFKNEFVPGLSIIDVLMFNSKEDVKSMLDLYELV